MRVIVWGINYAPEPTGIGPYNTALCEFLARRGHRVEMVSGFEYYPGWEKKKDDRGRAYRSGERAGVTVHRCWLYVPRKVRAWKRIAHELSFTLSSMLRVLALKRPDVFVVVSPPLLLGLAGAVVGFLKRAPFIFHVQDLQPDAAVRLGMLKGDHPVTRLLYGLESLAYTWAARISTISPGILRMMRSKRVPESKSVFFPNGVWLPEALPVKGRFRRQHGIAAEDFIVLYSGNLGVKQGLGALIDAARHLQQRAEGPGRVRFVIAGAGAMRDELATQVEREKLGNVLLLPLQPEIEYREMLADADCCAIMQQPGTGELFFPSKLLTTLAFAKPVLSIADSHSDLALAVVEGAFGVNVQPGSAAAVVRALDDWAQPGTDLGPLGERGRRYVGRFEMQEVLRRFEAEMEGVVRGTLTSPPGISSVVSGVAPEGETLS